MADRSGDWFAQAERNLAQAHSSRRESRHEWACFAAQQAAELAVKALHLHRGQEAWGHVVARLLAELPVPADEGLIDKARVLDNFYVPARCPNGHAEGVPFQHYGTIQCDMALAYAGEIIAFVRSQMA